MNPLDAELNVIRSTYIEKLRNQNLLIYVDMFLCKMRELVGYGLWNIDALSAKLFQAR